MAIRLGGKESRIELGNWVKRLSLPVIYTHKLLLIVIDDVNDHYGEETVV